MLTVAYRQTKNDRWHYTPALCCQQSAREVRDAYAPHYVEVTIVRVSDVPRADRRKWAI